jgi:hypothetical protein
MMLARQRENWCVKKYRCLSPIVGFRDILPLLAEPKDAEFCMKILQNVKKSLNQTFKIYLQSILYSIVLPSLTPLGEIGSVYPSKHVWQTFKIYLQSIL